MGSSTGVHHRFLRYRVSPESLSVVGLVDDEEETVSAILNQATGLPYSELYDLIEDYPEVTVDQTFQLVSGSKRALVDVEKLAPLTGRDILCIGKNYVEHAKEFNQSGFDASDKKDQPEFPVFFTKRASSIVPDRHPIYMHPTVTSSPDYEGELGIIIGRGGIQIKNASAWKHVWGAVIINDVTARERQRDHKQFFIGKSLDTFCPMGAYVVPSSSLSYKDLHLTTKVNGEVRQSQNTSELIFDVPTLIEVASMGITLQPGDVIATGTPYGTGMVTNTWLKEGDVVEISVPPLGVLTSPVASPKLSPFPTGPVRTCAAGVSKLGTDAQYLAIGSSSKVLHVEVSGPDDGIPVLFFHGLGATLHSYKAVVEAAGLEKKSRVILFDIEGHGRSPLSVKGHRGLTIEGFVQDGKEILDVLKVGRAHVVGHSMGGMIATAFAATYPDIVRNLVLIGPALHYWPEKKEDLRKRAALARFVGMSAVAEKIAGFTLSRRTLSTNPLAKAFVQQTIASSPQEGYALACHALAAAADPDFSTIKAEKVIVLAGKEDEVIPERIIDYVKSTIPSARIIWMEEIGHWHMLEDIPSMAIIFTEYLS